MQSENDFVQSHFTHKECVQFIPRADFDYYLPRCGCGEVEHKHYVSSDRLSSTNHWSPELIQNIGPTNAHGVVRFYSGAKNLQKSAKYLRLADDDNIFDVVQLFAEHWNLFDVCPYLCISLLGDMTSFDLPTAKKELICDSLVKVASASNGWILSYGLHSGVVDIVGEAISRAELFNLRVDGTLQKLHCIGVAPWGLVKSRETLIRSPLQKIHAVQYSIDYNVQEIHSAPLNENHDHYLFVDDGTRESFHLSKVAEFRKKLEYSIVTPRSDGGCGVPVVQIIIGGEFEILENTTQAVQTGIPIVVCGGTGKVADIMDAALHFWVGNKHSKGFSAHQLVELRKMFEVLLKAIDTDERDPAWTVERGIDLLETIMKKEKFVNCFDLNGACSRGCFDTAILFALVKCSTTDPVDQVMIALKFGRIDVVKEKIELESLKGLHSCCDSNKLNNLMTAALLENRIEFAEFLIEQKIVEMSNYLDVDLLTRLYNDIDDTSVMRRTLAHHRIRTQHTQPVLNCSNIASETSNFLNIERGSTQNASNFLELLAQAKKAQVHRKWINLTIVEKLLSKLLGTFHHPLYVMVTTKTKKHLFPNPFQELFLWAVLNNRNELAAIFWRSAVDPVVLSLIGCNLYEKMVKTLPLYDTEGRIALYNQKALLENFAKNLIELCYEKSQGKTMLLLVRPLKKWDMKGCLPLAMQANCREFISSRACQHTIKSGWCGGVDANFFSIALAYFCPILIWTRLIRIKSTSLLTNAIDDHTFQCLNSTPMSGNEGNLERKGGGATAGNLKIFYTSPKTKFLIHTMFYVSFLAFFSYALLFGLKSDSITPSEAVLFAYFASFCLETSRSFVKSMHYELSGRLSLIKWLTNDIGHAYDVGLIILSGITVSLRLGWSNTFIVAKTFYSMLLIFYFLRLFQIYLVHHKLGSSSMMICKMMLEMLIFLFILLIFLVPYGISTQAMLFPYLKEFNFTIVKNAFYYPYYRLYGELFLEQAEAQMEGCDAGEADGITCPMYNVAVPLLLAVYMLIVVILLINLLIAIFSNVFTVIENDSLKLWKVNRYYLLVEYKSKPMVPTPLSSIQILWEAIVYILKGGIKISRRLCCTTAGDVDKSNEGGGHLTEAVAGAAEYRERKGEEPDKEEDEEEEEEEEGLQDEDLENSFIQLQHWAIRKLLKQETVNENDQPSALNERLEKILEALEVGRIDNEPTPQSANELTVTDKRRISSKTSTLWQETLNDRIAKLETNLHNTLRHHEELLKQVLYRSVVKE